MTPRQADPVSKQATIVFGLIVVGFMSFGLAISFYRNVLFENSLEEIRVQNEELSERIVQSKRRIEYFKSEQFKDKFAKENLNKVNPGEHVLIIRNAEAGLFRDDVLTSSQEEKQQAQYEDALRQMPIFEHWKLYFFHRDKVEDLQQNL